LKKLLSIGLATLALSLSTGTAAFAASGTDTFQPGKACEHANLGANRGFDANHETGVDGGGTPPTCGGGTL
jgi:hypothetical protein